MPQTKLLASPGAKFHALFFTMSFLMPGGSATGISGRLIIDSDVVNS